MPGLTGVIGRVDEGAPKLKADVDRAWNGMLSFVLWNLEVSRSRHVSATAVRARITDRVEDRGHNPHAKQARLGSLLL